MSMMELLDYRIYSESQLVKRNLCDASEAITRIEGYVLALLDNDFITIEKKAK